VRPARPVMRSEGTEDVGRGPRPVTVHRTRPVVQGAYWTPTGRGHCGVRSVHQRVRSLVRFARLSVHRRVRSVTGPARPVLTSASGGSDQRVRSVVRKLAVTRPARPVGRTSASGATRVRLDLVPNGYIRRGTSINTRWPAQGSYSWTFDILLSTLS
jgi:hypothetical protein